MLGSKNSSFMFICHLFKQNVSISLRLSDSGRCRRGLLFLSMSAIFQLWHILGC